MRYELQNVKNLQLPGNCGNYSNASPELQSFQLHLINIYISQIKQKFCLFSLKLKLSEKNDIILLCLFQYALEYRIYSRLKG